MAAKRRLDAELVRRGLAGSRAEARRLIAEGRVTVGGAPMSKPASQVAADVAVAVDPPPDAYASRGGHKLAGALAELGVAVAGRSCLDAGASTGGFTDVLLAAGAARVVAVDVGYGQLAWRLRTDPRVVVLDRTNVRHLQRADLPPPPPDVVTADLSFISLVLVLPALARVAAAHADHLLLCKPQFEAGPRAVGKGGVVRDPAVWAGALLRVLDAARQEGLGLAGVVPSRLPGPAGNIEFFVHLRRDAGVPPGPALERAVDAARRIAGGEGTLA